MTDKPDLTPETLEKRLKELPVGGPLWRMEEAMPELYAHVDAWRAQLAADRKRLEALERERVAYLKAILPESPEAIQRITSRIIEMRDECSPELVDGLEALAADRKRLEEARWLLERAKFKWAFPAAWNFRRDAWLAGPGGNDD
jgi:hypothetical protein